MPQMIRARLAWSALAVLALIVLPLLARNLLAIPAHVPLDPNEGWNAAHTLRLMAGGPLYPASGLMVNNYPPLSFYAVVALTPLTGDAVVAGRLLAMLAFLLTCAGAAVAARRLGADRRGAGFAALVFASVLLVASDYVGIDDPQMLGHAVQMAGLLLVLRGRSVAAALAFALSLFIKHNLLALPLAAALWLFLQDRRAACRFIAAGAVAGLAGAGLFQLVCDTSLLAQLFTPRQSSLANVWSGLAHLWWAPLPLLAALALPRGEGRSFLLLYAGLALLLGLAFSAGDGVDANAFFDLAIACALIAGLTLDKTLPAPLSALPLLAMLALGFSDNTYFFTRAFARQSAQDIAYLKARPGPVLCAQIALCLWAGKDEPVDVFNLGERAKRGLSTPLTPLLEQRHFTSLQLDSPDDLGPDAARLIRRNYRLDHADDNGLFLVRR